MLSRQEAAQLGSQAKLQVDHILNCWIDAVQLPLFHLRPCEQAEDGVSRSTHAGVLKPNAPSRRPALHLHATQWGYAATHASPATRTIDCAVDVASRLAGQWCHARERFVADRLSHVAQHSKLQCLAHAAGGGS